VIRALAPREQGGVVGIDIHSAPIQLLDTLCEDESSIDPLFACCTGYYIAPRISKIIYYIFYNTTSSSTRLNKATQVQITRVT